MGLVFWISIHLEVASDSFCFLINSSWLLVFILFMICWKGIYFSYNLLHIGLIFSFHYWFRDLLREFDKKYEVLLIIFFLVFLLFLVSEGLLFVSFFWTSFHSLSSPTLGSWPQQGFYLPDPSSCWVFRDLAIMVLFRKSCHPNEGPTEICAVTRICPMVPTSGHLPIFSWKKCNPERK